MTVTSEISRVTYAGNDTTAPLPVPFYFLNEDDLTVILRSVNGSEFTEFPFIRNVHYTVTGAGNPVGGAVNPTSLFHSGDQIVIFRDPALTQDAAYVDHARFPAASHERALDKNVMVNQRTRELALRTMQPAETGADGVNAFQARGNRISSLQDGTALSDAATLSQVIALRDLLGLLGPFSQPIMASRTAATLASVAAGVTWMRTAGYAAAGDGGEAMYRRVPSQLIGVGQPVRPGLLRTADRYKPDGTIHADDGGWRRSTLSPTTP